MRRSKFSPRNTTAILGISVEPVVSRSRCRSSRAPDTVQTFTGRLSMATIPLPTPSTGILPQVPPSLLYAMLIQFGGSFVATEADLRQYDPDKHYMATLRTEDGKYILRLTDTSEATSMPGPMDSMPSTPVPSTKNLDASLLPLMPTNGHRLTTANGECLYFWNVNILGIQYSGWWDSMYCPTTHEQTKYLKYTPDGRKIS
jgi:hypothetical protein